MSWGEASVQDFACVRDSLAIRGTEYRPAGSRLPAAIGQMTRFVSEKQELE